MAPSLPPFAAIRVFEAAARHQNFTRAAEELGMSQASVSYQIKVLEERLGAALFLRRGRSVTLTEMGRTLAAPTTEAFDRLRTAFSTVDQAQGGTLSISTSPTFAANWLAPRLGGFQMSSPDLAVRLDAEGRNIDFAREEIDVAIRYGRGDWPGLVAHRLMASEFTPMIGRGLFAKSGPLQNPADILTLRILDPNDPYWAVWLAQAGIANPEMGRRVSYSLGSQANEIHAVLADQGVAMLSPCFFRHELETGRLVQPFEQVSTDGSAYWLVYPEARRTVRKIRAFRRWLEAECRDMAASR